MGTLAFCQEVLENWRRHFASVGASSSFFGSFDEDLAILAQVHQGFLISLFVCAFCW